MIIYKGYELMKAVSKGELNLKQKVSSLSLDYKDCTIGFVLQDIAFNIMNLDFELIEDKINIDNIKETEIKDDNGTEYIEYENGGYTESGYSRTYSYYDIDTRKRINELVQAVKQLNNKIKEKE